MGLDPYDGSGPFPITRIIWNMYKDMGYDVMIDRGLNNYGD